MNDKSRGFRFAAAGIAALVIVLSAASCPQRQEPQAGSSGSSGSQTAETDSARIIRLEREARAMAKTDGCGSVDQCRAAPVGARACGGPRDYIVYCARTTDSAGLDRKLAELRQAEIEFNRKTDAMSTCEFRTPPALAITAGSCKTR